VTGAAASEEDAVEAAIRGHYQAIGANNFVRYLPSENSVKAKFAEFQF
jgi:hypothetical protein